MTYFDEYKKSHVVLPHELLVNFGKIFSSELDFAVWLFYYENTEVAPSTIAKALNRSLTEINTSIKDLQNAGLIKVTILEIDGIPDTIFDPSFVFEKLDKVINNENPKLEVDQKKTETSDFADLLTSFEMEMGTMTPMQMEELGKWVSEDGYEMNLIKLALKEASINRKVNLNYIRGILRNWQQEGIKSANDVQRKQEDIQASSSEKKSQFYIPTNQWKK
jgi:DnaD and phage-associated domain